MATIRRSLLLPLAVTLATTSVSLQAATDAERIRMLENQLQKQKAIMEQQQKALELIEAGEKRIAKNEKKIRDANKDIRDAEKAIERGEGEIRKGTRDAEIAKARRLAIETDFKNAARIDDERAAEESVS